MYQLGGGVSISQMKQNTGIIWDHLLLPVLDMFVEFQIILTKWEKT